MKFPWLLGMRLPHSAILLSAALALAQDQESAIKVDVDVVNVLCTVRDQRGALSTDLKKEDFQIFENGKPQQIKYFTRDTDTPLTVALLVDVSASVRQFIYDEKGAVATFLQQTLRPDDRALLVGFASTIVLWQDLTSSNSLLGSALQRLRPVPFKGLPPLGTPMPSTLLYQAVERTADEKLKRVPGRKVMVIISDGLDNGSPVHLDAALESLQTANTIVYGVCFESGFSGCSFLQEMAGPTGGRTFRVKKLPIEKIFQIIEDETRSQYAIGYVSTNRTHDGTFRKLQVHVRPKGLRAVCRKGYYTAKPEPPTPSP
jgi:VWFA-related protein